MATQATALPHSVNTLTRRYRSCSASTLCAPRLNKFDTPAWAVTYAGRFLNNTSFILLILTIAHGVIVELAHSVLNGQVFLEPLYR